jgi:hypothetical protein
MSHPDNFLFRDFDVTFGIGQSEIEELYEVHAERVNDMCSRAWQEFPVGGIAERWSMVAGALLSAGDAMKRVGVIPSSQSITVMADELARAQDANTDGDIDGFKQNIGCYMHEFQKAVEQHERDAKVPPERERT